MAEETMKIARDLVVSLTYVLTDDEGVVIDRADADDPVVYLQGADEIIPGLENAVYGMAVGEDEVPAEMWSRLRKADTDADGLVSKSELEKVYSEREKYAPKGEVKKEDTPRKKRPELEKPSA